MGLPFLVEGVMAVVFSMRKPNIIRIIALRKAKSEGAEEI